MPVTMPVTVTALDHLVLNVADVARSAAWYQKVLGMEVNVFDPGHGKMPRTSVSFGAQKINLRPIDADKGEWFTADHERAGSDDLCFLTAATPEQVVAHLGGLGIAIEEGPTAKQGARGTLRSVLPRPRWQPDRNFVVRNAIAILFLPVAHTACLRDVMRGGTVFVTTTQQGSRLPRNSGATGRLPPEDACLTPPTMLPAIP